MLNLTRPNFKKLRNLLLRQQRKVEEDIKGLADDDPILHDPGITESSESGTDSWLADTHARVVAVRNNLMDLLDKTKKAIQALKKGDYGKCQKCGRLIEPERLEAMPTATLCIADSKKASKK